MIKTLLGTAIALLAGCTGAPHIPDLSHRACENREWTTVMHVNRPFPEEAILHFPTAAMIGGEVIIAGMLGLRDPDTALGRPPLTLISLTGRPLGLPPVSALAGYPKLFSNSADDLHMLWGEPDDTLIAFEDAWSWPARATRIRYARYSPPDGWSDPVEVVREEHGMAWRHGAGSVVLTQENDLHLAVLSSDQINSHLIHAVVRADGEVGTSRFPISPPSFYTALDVRGDTILIGYAAQRDVERLRPGFNVRTLRSMDGGISWSEPELIPLSEQLPSVTTVNIARHTDGDHHLVLGEAPAATSGWTAKFHHLRSSDWGRSWREGGLIHPDEGVIGSPQLVSDRCGELHFTHSHRARDESRIDYRRWTEDGWTESLNLSGGSTHNYYAFVQGATGLSLLFTDATRGRDIEMTLRRLAPAGQE